MRVFLFIFLGFCILAPPESHAENPNIKGKKIARKVYDRPYGNYSIQEGRMLLYNKGKEEASRGFVLYRVKEKENQVFSLIRFLDPADIKGTGLLTKDYPGDNTDQWIFLPALGRVDRVATSRKGGRFVNSDFFFEDLQEREVEMDRHRYLGKKEYEGKPCELIESIPVDSSNSVYSKRVACVLPNIWIPVKIDLYMDGDSEPAKRFQAQKIEKKQGYWVVTDARLDDLKNNHYTRLVTSQLKFRKKLPASLVSIETLQDPTREKKFR